MCKTASVPSSVSRNYLFSMQHKTVSNRYVLESISQCVIDAKTSLHDPIEVSTRSDAGRFDVWFNRNLTMLWSSITRSSANLEILEMKINMTDDRFRLYKMMNKLNQYILRWWSIEELRFNDSQQTVLCRQQNWFHLWGLIFYDEG